MRVVVVGLGVQGKKRSAIAGNECAATVDPINSAANFKRLEDLPLNQYDAALICTPDSPKYDLIRYCLENKKHVLVEKPLLLESETKFDELLNLSRINKVACYTAYNHRFEPHFINLKRILTENELGRIYSLRMFYGNGTAREVQNSPWRDSAMGVLPDLGSHLLDTIAFLFERSDFEFVPVGFHCWENKAFDHIRFASKGTPLIQLEASLLSWRNTFHLDVIGEHGSAHINCLCKWGPSTITVRSRILPSGKPPERCETLECADPTWQAEYAHFKAVCQQGGNNIETDRWIDRTILSLYKQHQADR